MKILILTLVLFTASATTQIFARTSNVDSLLSRIDSLAIAFKNRVLPKDIHPDTVARKLSISLLNAIDGNRDVIIRKSYNAFFRRKKYDNAKDLRRALDNLRSTVQRWLASDSLHFPAHDSIKKIKSTRASVKNCCDENIVTEFNLKYKDEYAVMNDMYKLHLLFDSATKYCLHQHIRQPLCCLAENIKSIDSSLFEDLNILSVNQIYAAENASIIAMLQYQASLYNVVAGAVDMFHTTYTSIQTRKRNIVSK